MELKCSLVRILGTAGADEQGPTHQSRDIWAGSRGRRVSAPLRTLAARIGPILRWAGKLHFQCLEGCAGGVIVRGQREVPNLAPLDRFGTKYTLYVEILYGLHGRNHNAITDKYTQIPKSELTFASE